MKKLLFVVNVDWFFISHRLPLAIEAKKRGYEVAIATSNTGRFKELEDYGFKLFNLKIDRSGTNPFKEILLIFRLLLILIRFRPAVIHNVTLKMSIYCSIATRIVHVPKVINAISGLGYNFTADRKTRSKKIINMLMKFAFNQKGLFFIFQNPDDFHIFKDSKVGLKDNYCLIKGVGIDLVKFVPVIKENSDATCFIMTARMLRDKGISEFITASKTVFERYPKSLFLLVGGIDKDNQASYTDSELRKEIFSTNVQWLGQRNDILELLQSSDVMVFPSYREGLPKSLIEAASVGLPIITTDTVGCRECVDEGINGFLVPVGNSNILADKMIELIKNPLLIKKMGIASRRKAVNEFSLSMVIDKTFDLYE